MRRSGVAVRAPVLAAAIGVDAVAEAHVGAVVLGDQRLRLVRQELRGQLARLRFVQRVVFDELLPVVNSPDSTLAVIASLIPLFTPFLMLLRIAIKTPPAWQIALGYVLTLALCAGMIWLCARIYRVGILMYGKRPTLKEIWRWVRYA